VRQMPRRSLVLVAIVASLALSACAGGVAESGPAAEVDGIAIDREPIAEDVRLLLEADPTLDTGEATRRLLNIAIQDVILQGLLEERGITITEEDIAATNEQILASIASEEELDGVLQELQFTRAFYDRVLVPFETRLSRMAEVVGQDLVIEQREARHILVETLEEAEAIVAEIADGADFAELAAERSSDPGSAANGGLLGARERGAFVPEFEEAVWAAELSTVLAPVETQFGFHVIEVVSATSVTGADLPIDQLRSRVVPDIEALIRERLATAVVSIAPGLGVWDAAAAQVVVETPVGSGPSN
jgi:parvulin-like peptidyl-prolyl isomerase